MGLKRGEGLLILMFLLMASNSMAAVGMASKSTRSSESLWQYWNYGFNHTDWFHRHHNGTTRVPSRIIVGGSKNWQFGFNYTDWALKIGPFYLNDTLVFKYDPPSGSNHPHSVYLLPDFWSFLNCDLKRAKLVADPTQGGGAGFEFTLRRWQPHYFACGERDGVHCNQGMMKFFVMPLCRR
ncbi:uncharacterized protein LOC127801705 [Diospyros lotus]|uniref:uncharacterized protein LOC127801705 n=1 Tax=Diospyros lotus TaxID=55363 RepID=UPI002250D72B|nr:uncharacterized protein LOC127801705 [Diospyros lotus]